MGVEYYSRPELYLGGEAYLEISPETFKVYEEIYGLGIAKPVGTLPGRVICSPSEGVLAVMCKVGISTLEASWIMRKFGVALEYWGLKDSEAEACQFVILRCLRSREVPARLGRKIRVHPLAPVGRDFVVRKQHISGNLFEVLLSCRSPDPAHLAEVVRSSAGLSLLNYFGYQRFGTVRPVTHLVGRAIATENWDEALKTLVGHQSELELPRVRLARKLFNEGSYRESLKTFPRTFIVERSVLRKYIETGNPKDAIARGLPHYMVKFFVEAYQSYLFNKALSQLVSAVGSVSEVERICEVVELPRPGIDSLNCGEFAKKALAEDLEKTVKRLNKSFFTKSVRETVFRVRDLLTDVPASNTLKLSFKLGRGSYATIYLRELLRENLSMQRRERT
ncbi:MAG: tRNA pseudouridine(13) synthase TruD [Sulfolobales archaeon]|nr:tRNA pseudouridine(13) synthase TruD [Sulfolobales archaeon]MCX8209130.1 tRNA pseudouridine(13) synthase TruD [Sulfolobales archaeon]MDW8010823.1 tRNA pseudouridine(13) synthase TruD [Sulfolobales archaeon]